jgi:hypothetical protein
MKLTLSIAERHHNQLKAHLFPGDNLEAIALVLCGRRRGIDSNGLLVHEVIPVPYYSCERAPDYIKWRTDIMPGILDHAAKKGFAVAKIHSHPNGYDSFSKTDDQSDKEYFNYLQSWINNDDHHASVIMFKDGRMCGRTRDQNRNFRPISFIKYIGDDIKFWSFKEDQEQIDEFGVRVAQSFGQGTYQLLKRLKIGVVGCSGTGSIVVEQLVRNCVGSLVLVDPDRIEAKNLNRIPQATMEDARRGKFKVDVLARNINATGFGTHVTTFPDSLFNCNVIKALAGCDVLFGCMDSIDGRHLLNKLAATYLIPYFDVGVKLIADGHGGVDQVCGTVHYLKPGGSSLLSRRVYTQEQLRAVAMKHSDPDAYKEQLRAGYIEGVDEERPAVISVNMLIASLGVNELLARIHPYRDDLNSEYAIYRIGLNAGLLAHEDDGEPCVALKKCVGRGDTKPLLGTPSFSANWD